MSQPIPSIAEIFQGHFSIFTSIQNFSVKFLRNFRFINLNSPLLRLFMYVFIYVPLQPAERGVA